MKDKFNREINYLRFSVTDNCNLRCIYCMEENQNEFLEDNEKLSCDEIYRIVYNFAQVGIKKVRITGGEPLVRTDIVELVGKMNKINGIDEIYLTTNGTLLLDKIEDLVDKGLKGVNISLDSLREDKFKRLTRVGHLQNVLKSIEKSLKLGIKVKINTVLIEDINNDEIADFINLSLKEPIDVRFIELMPIGIGNKYKGISNDEILKLIKYNYNYMDEDSKNKSVGPAKYIKIKDSKGRVGFISAMSNCFCKECNRVRVTADGFMKQCLHLNYGVDLKGLIRSGASDEEVRRSIYETIYTKPEKHLFIEKTQNKEIRFMNEIGG